MCALYVRCALSVLQKECRKVWGARYTLGARYRSENTVIYIYVAIIWVYCIMYVAIICCIMTCSISKGFVTYHGSMECEINYNYSPIFKDQAVQDLDHLTNYPSTLCNVSEE